ncbi:hypothetical protein QTP86_032820, partial [Hemibagrus guttatus]
MYSFLILSNLVTPKENLNILEDTEKIAVVKEQSGSEGQETIGPTIQLAKISKLLLAMEKGRLPDLQGKSLDDIEIEDEINTDGSAGRNLRMGVKHHCSTKGKSVTLDSDVDRSSVIDVDRSCMFNDVDRNSV